MTVEYQLTADDLVNFNLYHQSHSPAARRQYYRGLLVPPTIWLAFCLAIWYLADKKRDAPLQTFLDLMPLFFGVPLYLLLYPCWHRRRLRRTLSTTIEGENSDLLGRCRIAIAADGISEERELRQSTTSWNAVKQVVVADEYGYIYVNSLAAVILPRRAFRTEMEFSQFIDAATNYRRHHGR